MFARTQTRNKAIFGLVIFCKQPDRIASAHPEFREKVPAGVPANTVLAGLKLVKENSIGVMVTRKPSDDGEFIDEADHDDQWQHGQINLRR